MSKKNKAENPVPETEETKAPETEPENTAEQTEPEAADKAPEDPPKEDPVKALEAQLAERNDRYLRTLAEYENFRRRTQKEKEALFGDGKAEAIGKILPALDNFERAAAADGDFETYSVLERGSSIELRLPRAASLNRIQLQEYIPLGQRVKAFQVELYDGKQWNPLETEEETTTIGYKRILRFPTVRAKRLRLTILDSRAPVCLSEVAAFCAPAAH